MQRAIAGLVLLSACVAYALPTVRVKVEQRGDFALIGNTLAHDCEAPPPVIGMVNGCINESDDAAADFFWRADDPVIGDATANAMNTAAMARSTAMLVLPEGARVTHAFLYWGSIVMQADRSVKLEREGAFSTDVTALEISDDATNQEFFGVADVTALVKMHGAGAYRVSGVDARVFANSTAANTFAGWALVVFYADETMSKRTLVLADGLARIVNATPVEIPFAVQVPQQGFAAKLGVVAFEGDPTEGDQLFVNGAPISDAQNPERNFFNSSRSLFGSPVSNVGDMPQLTGVPTSQSGIDLDVVDVTSALDAGQSEVVVSALQRGDIVSLTTLVLAIAQKEPRFTFTKRVGEYEGTLNWSLEFTNVGDDAATGVTVTDVLPEGVSFTEGSADVDAAAATQYDATTRTLRIVFDAPVEIGGRRRINFATALQSRYGASLENQASLSARGSLGSPEATTRSDGDESVPGAQPTVFLRGVRAVLPEEPPVGCGCSTAAAPLWLFALVLWRRAHRRTDDH
ncbi:MAG: DUF11 domain-containing protein [Archangium sp.]